MARRPDFEIRISGLDELDKFTRELDAKLSGNLYRGFARYVNKNLVPRIKQRLSQASQPHLKSAGDPNSGIVGSAKGGYNTPKNRSSYRDWKGTRTNLPLVGDLSTRELVATGHLVDSIDLQMVEKTIGGFQFEVGPTPGTRPKTTPYKDSPPGSTTADLSEEIDNVELSAIIEDTKYAFWQKEFEDVQRDVAAITIHLVRITIKQMLKEYFTGPKPYKRIK